MYSKITAMGKKSMEVNEKKMEHVLQMKMLAKEMEEIKVWKFENTKILCDKMNEMEHKRKLDTIEFVATTRKKGKEEDVIRKERVKQGKLKI